MLLVMSTGYAFIVVSVSPRRQGMFFSTKTPPSIQKIPWPDDDNDDDPNLYAGWIFNEHDFEWFVDSEGASQSCSRSML